MHSTSLGMYLWCRDELECGGAVICRKVGAKFGDATAQAPAAALNFFVVCGSLGGSSKIGRTNTRSPSSPNNPATLSKKAQIVMHCALVPPTARFQGLSPPGA